MLVYRLIRGAVRHRELFQYFQVLFSLANRQVRLGVALVVRNGTYRAHPVEPKLIVLALHALQGLKVTTASERVNSVHCRIVA